MFGIPCSGKALLLATVRREAATDHFAFRGIPRIARNFRDSTRSTHGMCALALAAICGIVLEIQENWRQP
jgi:hypothetical protein